MKPEQKPQKAEELVLHRETIRNLSQDELPHVAGGAETQDPDCTQCTAPDQRTCTYEIDP